MVLPWILGQGSERPGYFRQVLSGSLLVHLGRAVIYIVAIIGIFISIAFFAAQASSISGRRERARRQTLVDQFMATPANRTTMHVEAGELYVEMGARALKIAERVGSLPAEVADKLVRVRRHHRVHYAAGPDGLIIDDSGGFSAVVSFLRHRGGKAIESESPFKLHVGFVGAVRELRAFVEAHGKAGEVIEVDDDSDPGE